MMFRKLVRRILGEQRLGGLSYFRHPELRNRWGGPFNNQKFRQMMFSELLYALPVKAIVETGSYRGTTTALFGATTLPVFSTEINPRSFGFSRMRFLMNRANVHLYRMDSRSFLRMLAQTDGCPHQDVFFYLDAHWGDDLPLRDELDIIFSRWKSSVVMVDDFKVPGTGYKYDDYGNGKVLDMDYIAPVVESKGLSLFFPAVGPEQETGIKRGCVVICGPDIADILEKKVATLRRFPLAPPNAE